MITPAPESISGNLDEIKPRLAEDSAKFDQLKVHL